MYHETNFGIAQEYVICNHLRYLSKWGMVCVFLGGVCLNVGCQVSYLTLPYRWALKDAIDLVAYSEAPDLLQDIQY